MKRSCLNVDIQNLNIKDEVVERNHGTMEGIGVGLIKGIKPC